jgi:hypothetical protein
VLVIEDDDEDSNAPALWERQLASSCISSRTSCHSYREKLPQL